MTKKYVDLNLAAKITLLYLMHFGNKNPDFVTCKDCVDYELGVCPGGADDVMDCMCDTAKSCKFYSNIG